MIDGASLGRVLAQALYPISRVAHWGYGRYVRVGKLGLLCW